MRRFLGITILGDYIVHEGIETVLDNVTKRAEATAVACNPTVSEPSSEGQGSLQPPHDAGASPRLFDRPLFGKTEFWVRAGPSYHPNQEHYLHSPYPPREPNDITKRYGATIGEFIRRARDRGLKVYLQIGAAQPHDLRDEDKPNLPNGRLPNERMANTGSLASEAIRTYNRSYLQDLLSEYPDIDGFRPDWPEYPCYKLDEAFQDFSPHAETWAESHGFNFAEIRESVANLYNHLHGSLTNRELGRFACESGGSSAISDSGNADSRFGEWLHLKAALSVDLLRSWREVIDEFSGERKELLANAFMPPFSTITGFDFSGASRYCDAISPKLYTMHWSAIVEFWGSVLLNCNPDLDESLLVQTLAHLFDLDDEHASRKLSYYRYPKPTEPHPISSEVQSRKIDEVLSKVGGQTAVTPIVHGYGPFDDFCRRFQVVANSQADGVWINRYGYLSNQKLDAVGKIWS